MASKVIVRSAFLYDSDALSDDTAVKEFSESMTDQSQKEDADINTLIKRFGITGEIPVLDRLPVQGDFVGNMTYHEAQNALLEADAAFMELPAELRARFHHDPGQFVQFCSNKENKAELLKLGLMPAPPDPIVPIELAIERGMRAAAVPKEPEAKK